MEDQKTVTATHEDRGVSLFDRRGVRIAIVVMSAIALLPIAGIVFAFGVVLALPLILATALVAEPQHWVETFDEEVDIILSRPEHQFHHHPAHA